MNPACSEMAIGISAGIGSGQDVGIRQHFGGLPPAEPAVRREVENGDECQLERNEEIAAERAAEHRGRRGGIGRPYAPELRLPGKGLSREALRRHEHEPVGEAAAQHDGHRRADLARPEGRRRLRGVEVEPCRRRARQARRRHQRADDETRGERRARGEPMRPREPQHAEDAAAEPVEEPRRDAGDAGDRVVRAAQLAEPPLERFRNVHVRRDLDQLVAGDGQAKPDARLAQRLGALVDERMIDAPGGSHLLRLLEQRVRREIEAPIGLGPLFARAHARRRRTALSSLRRAHRFPERGGKSRSARHRDGSGS